MTTNLKDQGMGGYPSLDQTFIKEESLSMHNLSTEINAETSTGSPVNVPSPQPWNLGGDPVGVILSIAIVARILHPPNN